MRAEIIADLWANARTENNCDSHSLPNSVVDFITEVDRGLYTLLLAWDKESNPIKILGTYMVRDNVVEHIVSNILEYSIKPAKEQTASVVKPSDKYRKLEKHALDNMYTSFSTDSLMEISGLSRPAILNWLKTNGFYKSIKRGEWEARNPKEDRERSRL